MIVRNTSFPSSRKPTKLSPVPEEFPFYDIKAPTNMNLSRKISLLMSIISIQTIFKLNSTKHEIYHAHVKMSIKVGILTFISMINTTTSESLTARKFFIFQHFNKAVM